MNKDLPLVVCFGEILWDIFPEGEKAGGAPMNVAVNLSKLGVNAILVSKTGNDEKGNALKEFLKALRIDTSYLQTDPYHKTGIVEVKIGANRNAQYDIVFPSAWDFIELNAETDDVVSAVDYVVFGSLACRNIVTRSTLFNILEKAKRKVFDINLRYPHYEKALIETLLSKADVVKVNEEELQILNKWFFDSGPPSAVICKKLQEKFKIDQLIITLGEKGAMVSYGDTIVAHDGFAVEVEDTVGSGDAFLAAFLARQIAGKSVEESLEFACATGAYIVTRQGANPQYDESQIVKFIKTRNYETMITKPTI